MWGAEEERAPFQNEALRVDRMEERTSTGEAPFEGAASADNTYRDLRRHSQSAVSEASWIEEGIAGGAREGLEVWGWAGSPPSSSEGDEGDEGDDAAAQRHEPPPQERELLLADPPQQPEPPPPGPPRHLERRLSDQPEEYPDDSHHPSGQWQPFSFRMGEAVELAAAEPVPTLATLPLVSELEMRIGGEAAECAGELGDDNGAADPAAQPAVSASGASSGFVGTPTALGAGPSARQPAAEAPAAPWEELEEDPAEPNEARPAERGQSRAARPARTPDDASLDVADRDAECSGDGEVGGGFALVRTRTGESEHRDEVPEELPSRFHSSSYKVRVFYARTWVRIAFDCPAVPRASVASALVDVALGSVVVGTVARWFFSNHRMDPCQHVLEAELLGRHGFLPVA